jgi:hypothetical protein
VLQSVRGPEGSSKFSQLFQLGDEEMSTKINFGKEVSAKLRSMLIAEAEKIADENSQYKDYFDNHLLVVANKEIIGRYSKICDAGEFLLAKPEVLQFLDEKHEMHQSICIWDNREQIADDVPYSDINFVDRQVKISLRIDNFLEN